MTADELKQTILALPPLPDEGGAWLGRRKDLRAHILNDDPAYFRDWSVIRATMGVRAKGLDLDTWERKTGLHINQMKSIVEFGGGYGLLCAFLCTISKFRGNYHSYDFPEM